jgi:hypothetical protein
LGVPQKNPVLNVKQCEKVDFSISELTVTDQIGLFLRGYEMLHHGRVVIKLVVGLSMKQFLRHGWSKWDLPFRNGRAMATLKIGYGHTLD